MFERPILAAGLQAKIANAAKENPKLTGIVLYSIGGHGTLLSVTNIARLHEAVHGEQLHKSYIKGFLNRCFVSVGVLDIYHAEEVLTWPVDEPLVWHVSTTADLSADADRLLERFFKVGWKVEDWVSTKKLRRGKATLYYYCGEPLFEGLPTRPWATDKLREEGCPQALSGCIALANAFVAMSQRKHDRAPFMQESPERALVKEACLKEAGAGNWVGVLIKPWSALLWNLMTNHKAAIRAVEKEDELYGMDSEPTPDRDAVHLRELILGQLEEHHGKFTKSGCERMEIW